MNPIRRVLIVHPYGIGDLLFITPVLRALRLLPGIEKIDLLLGSRTDAVVRANPHVDDIMIVDKDLFHRQGKWKTFTDVRRLAARLGKEHYDLLLDYSMRGEYAFFSRFFLGIPRRAGFDYKRRGFFHNIRLPIPDGFRGRHVADYFCDLAEMAGIPVKDRHFEFYVTEQDREEVRTLLAGKTGYDAKRFFVIAPGGGESWGKDAHFKQWPAHFFAELASGLKIRYGMESAVILGSGNEKEKAEELAGALKFPALNLCGRTSLGATAVLIQQSAFFLGNDGGLMHLAHALRVPVIAFFGPVDPQVYGPYPASQNAAVIIKEDLDCRPCYQKFRYKSDCTHRNCLQALTPQEAAALLDAKQFHP